MVRYLSFFTVGIPGNVWWTWVRGRPSLRRGSIRGNNGNAWVLYSLRLVVLGSLQAQP